MFIISDSEMMDDVWWLCVVTQYEAVQVLMCLRVLLFLQLLSSDVRLDELEASGADEQVCMCLYDCVALSCAFLLTINMLGWMEGGKDGRMDGH